MLAAYLSEHSLDSGWEPSDDGTAVGAIGFSDSTAACAMFPSDAELLAARALIPEGCGLTDAEKRAMHPSRQPKGERRGA
jgi:hypothetical protein